MNNNKRKKRWSYIWKIAGTVAVIVIVACSVTVNSVDQPASVNAGQPLNITLNATIVSNNPQTSNLIIGVLVPKVWNASANMTMTFSSTISSGNQPMSVIPSTTPSTGGNGLNWPTDMLNTLGHAGNLIPEYEWVAFESTAQYTIGTNATVPIVVNITINVGQANVNFNMAYVVCESGDGLHSTAYSDPSTDYYGTFTPTTPLRVYGTGTLLDFVNPQLSVATPSTALDNDIISIPFNSTLLTNGLSSATAVYLCATGYTSAGDSITVCQQTSKTALQSTGQGNWQIDMWPRGFFNLTTGQTLDSLHYFFTDPTGTVKVGSGGSTTSPFSFTFNCQ